MAAGGLSGPWLGSCLCRFSQQPTVENKTQSVQVECSVLYRQKALVSINKASVSKRIYWLAEEEHKRQSHLALDSAMLIVNAADRRPKENPGASLKTHCSEHLLQSSAKASGDTVYSEVMRSLSSSRAPLLSFPYRVSLCLCFTGPELPR